MCSLTGGPKLLLADFPILAVSDHELLELIQGQGARNEKALDFVHAECIHVVSLTLCFYALGNGRHAKLTAQCADGGYDGTLFSAFGDVCNKAAINLNGVNGKVGDVGKGRVASTKVVYRKAEGERFQSIQKNPGLAWVMHRHPFGNLEFQPLVGQIVPAT